MPSGSRANLSLHEPVCRESSIAQQRISGGLVLVYANGLFQQIVSLEVFIPDVDWSCDNVGMWCFGFTRPCSILDIFMPHAYGRVFESRAGSAVDVCSAGPLPWKPFAVPGIYSQLCNINSLHMCFHDEDADMICETASVDQDLL